MAGAIKLRDERELFVDDVGSYSAQKPEPPKKTAEVYNFLDEWAKRRSPAYARAREAWKYATGEEKLPTGSEILNTIYKKHIETPVKKKIRDIVAKRGAYALEKFDEGIVRYAIDDYKNRNIEVPVIQKERVEYENEEVWGFQNREKIEHLSAYRMKKMLGKERSDKIKNELGLDDGRYDKALKDYVVMHELAEKRLMEYMGIPRLSKEKHAWLQATIGNYLTESDDKDMKTVGKLAYKIDSLRNDELGLWTRDHRMVA